MAEKHPYVISSGPLIQFINHLRKSFPGTITSDTLKKLGYAKKNESYVINTLRFMGVIDDEGKKTDKAGKVFSQHEDKAFQREFSALIKAAYSELFALHSDEAWKLDIENLITFFRETDQSSAIVGKKQASTFCALAALSGYGEIPELKKSRIPPVERKTEKISSAKLLPFKKELTKARKPINAGQFSSGNVFGLTVRVEINLPAEGNQETYDRIFKSIKENLLSG